MRKKSNDLDDPQKVAVGDPIRSTKHAVHTRLTPILNKTTRPLLYFKIQLSLRFNALF